MTTREIYVAKGDFWRRAGATPLGRSNPRNQLVYGTYEPNAATTGVLPGTTFPASRTIDAATTRVTEPGTIFDGYHFRGRLDIRAGGVRVRNCLFTMEALSQTATSGTSAISTFDSTCVDFRASDCTIYQTIANRHVNGHQGHDAIIERCDISRVTDGSQPFNNNTGRQGGPLNTYLLGNYIHDLLYISPNPDHADNESHTDCIQVQGGQGLHVIGNSLWAYLATDIGNQGYAGSASRPADPNYVQNHPQALATLMVNDLAGQGPYGMVVEDNWMRGGSISVNAGDGGIPQGANLGRMWRTKFTRDQYLQAGSARWPTIAMPSHTIDLRSDLVCDTGDGTANQNVYIDPAGNVLGPITVRRNA